MNVKLQEVIFFLSRQRLEAMESDLERVQAAADRLSKQIDENDSDEHEININKEKLNDTNEKNFHKPTPNPTIIDNKSNSNLKNNTNVESGEEWEATSIEKDPINITEVDEEECERFDFCYHDDDIMV